MEAERATLLFAVVVLLNVLWFLGIRTLRRTGHRVSWFGGHFGDLGNLWRLSRETSDENTRTHVRALLVGMAVALIAFVMLLFGWV